MRLGSEATRSTVRAGGQLCRQHTGRDGEDDERENNRQQTHTHTPFTIAGRMTGPRRPDRLFGMRARRVPFLLLILVLAGGAPVVAGADPLDDLARDVWAWRAATQPSSGDAIPQHRPAVELAARLVAGAVASRRAALLRTYTRRHQAIVTTSWPVARQVDYRLIGSLLARVRWELDGAPAWRRDPAFYIQQALGPVFDVLLPPPPVGPARADLVLARLAHVPVIVGQARQNLDDTRAPFARLAIDTLGDIDTRLATLARELDTAAPSHRGRFAAPAATAAAALVDLRRWLEARVAAMPGDTTVGRDAYVAFLREVALVPFTPEEIVAMGRQEWERAVAFEALEQGRNRALPQMAIFPDADAQVTTSAAQERDIRAFLEREGLLTVPPWLGHYSTCCCRILAPIAFLGVTDDLTGPSRLSDNGYSYIRAPRPDLAFTLLHARSAADHRTKGCPATTQLAIAWAHENPIRRHYYDSGA
jgi:hypothetical protein